jgi:hypothetical protein
MIMIFLLILSEHDFKLSGLLPPSFYPENLSNVKHTHTQREKEALDSVFEREMRAHFGGPVLVCVCCVVDVDV